MLEWWRKAFEMKLKRKVTATCHRQILASAVWRIIVVQGPGGQTGSKEVMWGWVTAMLLPSSLIHPDRLLLDWVAAGQALINAAGLGYHSHGCSIPHSYTNRIFWPPTHLIKISDYEKKEKNYQLLSGFYINNTASAHAGYKEDRNCWTSFTGCSCFVMEWWLLLGRASSLHSTVWLLFNWPQMLNHCSCLVSHFFSTMI